MIFDNKKMKNIVLLSASSLTGLGIVFSTATIMTAKGEQTKVESPTEIEAMSEESEIVKIPEQKGMQKIELVEDEDHPVKVQNGQITDEMARLRDEQIRKILEENNLTAADLGNYKEAITKDVMTKIQTVLDKYESSLDDIEFIKGESGKNGENGKDGKNGTQGLAGSRGTNGVAGKEGKAGINGKDGIDGKSTYSYIVYADNYSGGSVTGFSKTKTATSRYIGTCSSISSTGPTSSTYSSFEISWQEISDYVITYDESSNTVVISK